MPWLAATALLHSVTVLAARDALKAWTMMLAVIAFSMSMVGTFLVRSGILTSVHAFAVDPQRGTFILALLAHLRRRGLRLVRGARRARSAKARRSSWSAAKAALVVNNLLLSVILGIVFVGTLYPLIAEAVTGEKIVGRPALFQRGRRAAGADPARHLLAVGPLLRWRREKRPVLRKLALPGAVRGDGAGRSRSSLAAGDRSLPRFGLALAAGCSRPAILPLVGRNPLRTPLATWGMAIAHFGVAVALAGMAADSAFTREKLAAARPGETLEVGPWLVQLRGVAPVAGPNWTALEAELRASRGGGVHVLQAADPLLHRPADRDQRSGDRDLLERPALRRARQAGRGRGAGSCACGGSRS